MRKSIILTSLAAVSLSLHGMQDAFIDKMKVEETHIRKLPLVFNDDSNSQDTASNKGKNSEPLIQWDIFEGKDKGDQQIQKDIFSDSSDIDSLPSVNGIFEEILNPKEKIEQIESSDNPVQTRIELPEASSDIIQLPRKISDQPSIIGDKRKASETDNVERDSIKKKRIKTSSYKGNDSNNTIIEKENSLKNRKRKRYFAKKTGLKMHEFLVKSENDEVREIEGLKSQVEALRTGKIRLQTRQNQLRIRNDKVEDRIEELENLVLEKEVELELERSNNQNIITQRIEIEKKSKDLSQQIDFLKHQVSTLQTSEEESKKQKEQLNLKITEQNKKITNLNHLLKNKETGVQMTQQKNNTPVVELTKQLNIEKGKDPSLIFSWNQIFKGAEILKEKDKEIAELTKQLNNEREKEPRLISLWNQTLSRLKNVQQREQTIQNREAFWNNLLINKDGQIQRFQIEKNNIFAQQQQSQAMIENLATQLQQSQVEVTNLTEQLQKLQETQKEAQNTLKIKEQELAELKAKIEIKPIKQEVDSTKKQQTDNKFEDLYKQAERRLKNTEKRLEDSVKEIHKIQNRYEMELKKKEGYKSQVNRLSRALADEQKKSEQPKKGSDQADIILNKILLGERWWQNVLKPLNASQKKNEDLREYLIRLMKHSSTRSLINRFSRDEYSKEIVRQLTHNVDIKEHVRILDNNQYYWSTSKINMERELFSKSNGYGEDLLKKLKDRNDRTQKQLDKIDRDNEFLMQIIRELKKDKDIGCYIHDGLELHQPELTTRIDRYLTPYKSINNQEENA